MCVALNQEMVLKKILKVLKIFILYQTGCCTSHYSQVTLRWNKQGTNHIPSLQSWLACRVGWDFQGGGGRELGREDGL